MFKRIISILMIACMLFVLVACGDDAANEQENITETADKTDGVNETSDKTGESVGTENAAFTNETKASENKSEKDTTPKDKVEKDDKTVESTIQGHPVVTVVMENGESFKMELYPEYAPRTVENFVALAESGFYNGVGFHRIVEGFMAQGGDPEGTGMGGSDKSIVGEFSANGFAQNTLSHTRGVVSMARSQMPDSASSQFFICYDDASFLDGNYAAFGKVIEGMETVDGFLDIERVMGSDGDLSAPVEPIIMKTVTVKR